MGSISWKVIIYRQDTQIVQGDKVLQGKIKNLFLLLFLLGTGLSYSETSPRFPFPPIDPPRAPLADVHREERGRDNNFQNATPPDNSHGNPVEPASRRRPVAPQVPPHLPEQENQPDALYTPANPPPSLSLDLAGVMGTDRTGNEIKGACQATPTRLAEFPQKPGMCKLALYTAAHCVVNDDGTQRRAYELPTLKGFGGRVFVKGVPGWNFNRFAEVVIPTAFMEQTRLKQRQSQGVDRGFRSTVSSDGAVIFLTAPCEEFSQVKTVDFSPRDGQGFSRLGRYTWVQKRNQSVGRNRGTSRQLQAQGMQLGGDKGETMWFVIPSSQGPEAFGVVGGDSGGGVFDDRGRLVGATSGSTLGTAQNLLVQRDANGHSIVPQHQLVIWGKGAFWAEAVINNKMSELNDFSPSRRLPEPTKREVAKEAMFISTSPSTNKTPIQNGTSIFWRELFNDFFAGDKGILK